MSAAVAASPPSAASRPRRRRRSRTSCRSSRGGGVMWSQTSSMSNGRSGTRMTSAPPAMPDQHGDPARVAAHDLADDDAVVRLGRRVQAVDRLGRDLHRGLKAEREVRRVEVVVDRLGHADGREARREELARDAERVVAADRDQHVDAALLQRREHALLAVLGLVDVRARGAEDRAALVQDAARVLARQLDRVVVEHALPALAKAEDLVPVVVDPLADDSADDGVEAGAVAAACQKSDSCHARHPATRVPSAVGTLVALLRPAARRARRCGIGSHGRRDEPLGDRERNDLREERCRRRTPRARLAHVGARESAANEPLADVDEVGDGGRPRRAAPALRGRASRGDARRRSGRARRPSRCGRSRAATRPGRVIDGAR